MSGGRNRASLSDWWSRPDGACEDTPDSAAEESDLEADQKCDSVCSSPAKRSFSPTRRDNPNFFIGDDSDCQSIDCSLECSPRKRVAMSPMSAMSSARGDVGSMGRQQEASINTAMMSILRGICADYFENNVSPVLRYVQQTQEQLMTRLNDVNAALQRKAEAEDLTSPEEIERIAARAATSRMDDSKVAMRVRMEHLADSLKQKADTNNVASLAQLGLKANTKDQGELEVRVRTAEQKVATLSEELRQLKETKASGASPSPEATDTTKLKAVFAAAGLRVDRQIKEMRQQMKQLREECLGKDVGERWPGRKLDLASAPSVQSALSLQSDNDSDRLSVGGSVTGSELAFHEQAELKKIRAIVAVAGKAFSRDLNDVKKQIRELRTEVHAGK